MQIQLIATLISAISRISISPAATSGEEIAYLEVFILSNDTNDSYH